jgi:hypothetical protein
MSVDADAGNAGIAGMFPTLRARTVSDSFSGCNRQVPGLPSIPCTTGKAGQRGADCVARIATENQGGARLTGNTILHTTSRQGRQRAACSPTRWSTWCSGSKPFGFQLISPLCFLPQTDSAVFSEAA